MKRAIGFQQGLRGDLVFSTIAARSLKEQYPDWHLTLGVGPQFKDLLPLFHDHESFDAVHTYTTYDGWPGPRDLDYLQAAKYDLVFNAMPPHLDQQWWLHRHQYAEAAHMVGLPVPADIQPRLTRWFHVEQFSFPTVAIAPFGGNGGVNDKMLSVEQAQAIVDYLVQKGYMVLHLGAPSEPRLKGAQLLPVSYFDSVRNMLSCKVLIHCDTGMGHVAGAFNHPSLGLYGHRYFGAEWVHQIMPRHANFISEVAPTVAEISLDKVFKSINLLLS